MRSCPDTDIDPVFFGVNVPARAVSHGNSSPGKAVLRRLALKKIPSNLEQIQMSSVCKVLTVSDHSRMENSPDNAKRDKRLCSQGATYRDSAVQERARSTLGSITNCCSRRSPRFSPESSSRGG